MSLLNVLRARDLNMTKDLYKLKKQKL